MEKSNPSEKEIFAGALQLSTPAERVAYLKTACGDDAQLRQRIEGLLQASEDAGTFLDQPAAASAKTPLITTGTIPVTEKAGDKIGRYKLREQIGEGGCGVVYVADQEEPVRRRVALKVIKLGMDTKQVVARFEAERQALALMDHPNIAKVLDAGSTDTGRPYFVMELVRGVKITDYCDKHNLSTAERLKLFIQVCSAIQHAHQKGIIHRDIKPSNILVTLHDGVPVPKVIDFGIAKATSDQRLTDKTIYTAFEQFLGTPAYMSPEQAEMSGLDIDTRSDIYSLGVLLYELLTGRPPFDAATLLKAGLDQMRRIIREQEPQRPSTRLSTLEDADLTAVANHRHAEPPKLVHLIRGDLDWIVMKSLEKDRTRRYETVNGLAMDIQRHQSYEPIAARPPSTFYRFQKLVRRNKIAFAAGSVVAGSLVLGLGFSTYLFLREKQARQRAVTAEKAALSEAEENREILDLFGVTYGTIFSSASGDTQRQLTQILDNATESPEAKSIQVEPKAEVRLRVMLGLAYKWLGQDKKADSMFRRVVDLRTRLPAEANRYVILALSGLSFSLVYSDPPSAEKMSSEAVKLARESHKLDWEVVDALHVLGRMRERRGDMAGAEEVYREAVTIARRYPGLYGEEAASWSGAICARLLDLLRREGKLAEAQQLLKESPASEHLTRREAAKAVPNGIDPEPVDPLLKAGMILVLRDDFAGAERSFREALAIRQKLPPEDPAARSVGIVTYSHLAAVLQHQGKYDELKALLPEVADHGDLGVLHDFARFLATAIDPRARDGSNAVILAEKAVKATSRKSAMCLDTLAAAYGEAGQFVQAVSIEKEAIVLLQDDITRNDYVSRLKLYESNSPFRDPSAGVGRSLGRYFGIRGGWLAQQGKLKEAAAHLTKATELDSGEHLHWYFLAPLLLASDDPVGYRKHCQAMLVHFGTTSDPIIAERTAKACLLLPLSGPDLATASRLADLAVTVGKNHEYASYFQFAKALAEYRQGRFAGAVEWALKTVAKPGVADYRDPQAYMVIAMAHQQQKHPDKARTALAKGIGIAESRLSMNDSGYVDHDGQIFRILAREAKQLIEGGSKTIRETE